MTDSKISQLNDGGDALGTDELPAVRGGVNVRVNFSSYKDSPAFTGTGTIPILGVGFSGTPDNTLEIRNVNNTQIRVRNGASSTQSYDFGRNGSTGLMTFYGNQTGFAGYVFSGVDGEWMRIDANGNMGIGGTANANAIFHVQSTTKQAVPAPPMTTAQKNSLTPLNAGQVYDDTLKRLSTYNGTNWQVMALQPKALTDQTITSAGTLTVAHGLPYSPMVDCYLVCTGNEHGYTVGQVIKANLGQSNAAADNLGASIMVDATHVIMRYGSRAAVFAGTHATTGAGVDFTNTNWNFRIVVI
jgi:hypothetical protein